ncbi:MAG: hypothetical protein KKE86_00965 [Planctomycetes bacterium]|nr:hypothetical protein [Planctomycetota bacterium]MBU4397882.1 hypothetical protein [Planctomycetota bacterium]MCG2684419.1 hypothetical protein [Planctomycetales bacterium]
MDRTNRLADEVQELVWALVDDQATDAQVRRLEELLLDDSEARRVYVTCMQMHADLHYLLSDKRPRLPPAVEKAIESQRTKKSAAPLPVVDLPPAINVQFPDVFA